MQWFLQSRHILHLALWSFCLCSSPVWGQQTEVAAPAAPTSFKSSQWIYRVFTWVAIDIDSALKEQSIEITSCQFQSLIRQRVKSYHGLGPCLYENFTESMKSEALSGYVFAWGTTPWGEIKGLRIEWRPVKGGFMEAIKAWWDLQTEPSKIKNKSNVLGTDQSLVGSILLAFPLDFPVQRLAMDSKPVLRKDGIIEFQGTLQVTSLKNPMANSVVTWKSNVNPIHLERKFYFHGQAGLSLGQGKMP